MKILWLASWYPNPYEPVNGDFIQRHAKAVAQFIPLDVIHVVQVGKDVPVRDEQIENQTDRIREMIYSFSFQKWGIGWVDKIRYQLKYRKFYIHILLQYEKLYGKPGLIHVHVPLKAGVLAIYFKKRWKIPYIVSEQSSHYEKAAHDSFDRRSLFFRYQTRAVFRGASLVTNVSASIGKILQQRFGLKPVQVVPNLADISLFKLREDSSPGSTFRWLHVSSLNRQKNADGIIEAFCRLNQIRQDWELVVVGPHPELYNQQVKQAGMSAKVSFTGELPYREVAKQMQKATAFVLFSRHENFPCVLVEALCTGLPVVASRVGGVGEAVDDSNGILVPAEDVEALANALNTVMNQYQRYSPQAIAAAASEKYSPHRIGSEFYTIYRGMVDLS